MRRNNREYCQECGEKLTTDSTLFDGYGTPRWYCTNEDCENYWLD